MHLEITVPDESMGGAWPSAPKDEGTKITPPQSWRAAQLGVHVANQLGTGQLDSKKATLLCVPSVIAGK